MALSRVARKHLMLEHSLTGADVARACGVGEHVVSHVLAGTRLNHAGADRVMGYLAARFGLPLAELFPTVPPRRSGGRPPGRNGTAAA